MKYVVTVLCLFLMTNVINCQESFVCGNKNIENHILYSNRDVYTDTSLYTIPVIVNILHNGEDVGSFPNISDNDVIQGIEDLNLAFSGQLNETMLNSNIIFCLSNINDVTSIDYGIRRYNVNELDWFNGNWNVSNMNNFFLDCVNNISYDYEHYLNIFVAPTINTINGLGGADYVNNYGGVFVNTTFYVFEDDITFPNQVLPHEVGHYLGLSHTFNSYESINDCSFLYEENCSTQGDYVCDTPPTNLHACYSHDCYSNNSEEFNILKTNFMGYTLGCANKFTEGQINRMRLTIQQTSRTSLTENICTCFYIENYECLCNQEENCTHDLSGNGIVDMQDLLIMLGNIFNNFDCSNGDFDGSGYVDTLDLLDLLSVMGNECY